MGGLNKMDWMAILIAIGFVWTGAVFIGFPVGYAYAKRRFYNGIDPDFVIIDYGENGFRRISKSENNDVLSAEIIEEAKR